MIVLISGFAQAIDQQYDFNIDEQTLSEVLDAVVQQTGTLVLYPPELADAKGMQPISGRYTVSQALDIVFRDTGFSGGLTERGVIFISQEESEETALPESDMNKNSGFIAAVLGLFVSTGGAQHVVAQDAETSVGSGRASLEEIVVTARKREESLVDVPVSISVFSDAVIDEAGIQEPRDFFEMTPGIDFDIEHDRAGSQPAIRGVQSNNTATTRQKITSFIDGVPMAGASGTIGFAGVERIEVFRGPQSAAFGRATFAGAINYVTQDPGADFEGKVELQASEFGRNKAQIELAGPINDSWGYAVAALSDAYDGPDDWVSVEGFDVGGSSTNFFSGKLKFTPNDRFSAEVMARYTLTDDDIPLRYFISPDDLAACSNFTTDGGRPYIRGTFSCNTDTPVGGVQTNADAAAPFQDATVYSDADRALAETFRFEPLSENERKRLQGEFTYSFDSGDLQLLAFVGEESIDRWYDRDRSASPLQIVSMTGTVTSTRNVKATAGLTDIEESSYELRWLSNGTDRFSWAVGASYYDYDFTTLLYGNYAIIVDGGTSNPYLIFAENSQNAAVFANLTYDFTDRTTLSLEGRYQSEDMANLNTITNSEFTNTSTAFLPRIAINHDFGNGVHGYAQVSKGVNPAGVNPTAASPGIQQAHQQAKDLGYVTWNLEDALYFEQEEMINTEIGLKATLMDNRLQLSAALYQMDWKHYNQIRTIPFDIIDSWEDGGMVGPEPVYAAGLTSSDYSLRAYLDLGSASVAGFEGEATFIINDQWDVSGSLTLSTSEFDNLCDADAVSSLRMTPTNVPSDGSGVLFECVDVSGNEFIRQPNEAYALATTYRTDLSNTGWDLLARLDYRVVGEQWLDAMNIAALPASTTVNASVTFGKENLKVQLWGRNLTNDDTPRVAEYNTGYNESPSGSPNFNILPREPSELGVTLSYSF